MRRPENAPAKSIEERLKLRIAGLSGTIREVTAEKHLVEQERDALKRELERERRRRVMTPTPQQIEKKSDETSLKRELLAAREATATVKTALNDARKRERRAVELGGALRRRVGDERRRADAAENECNELKRRLAAVEAERDGEQRRLIMRRDADRRRTESYTKFAEAAAEASKREEALRDQLREAQNRGTRRARDLEALRRAAEDRCTDAEREASGWPTRSTRCARRWAARRSGGSGRRRRARRRRDGRPHQNRRHQKNRPTGRSRTRPRRRRRRRAAGPRRTGRASCRGATTRRRATSASRRPSGAADEGIAQ